MPLLTQLSVLSLAREESEGTIVDRVAREDEESERAGAFVSVLDYLIGVNEENFEQAYDHVSSIVKDPRKMSRKSNEEEVHISNDLLGLGEWWLPALDQISMGEGGGVLDSTEEGDPAEDINGYQWQLAHIPVNTIYLPWAEVKEKELSGRDLASSHPTIPDADKATLIEPSTSSTQTLKHPGLPFLLPLQATNTSFPWLHAVSILFSSCIKLVFHCLWCLHAFLIPAPYSSYQTSALPYLVSDLPFHSESCLEDSCLDTNSVLSPAWLVPHFGKWKWWALGDGIPP